MKYLIALLWSAVVFAAPFGQDHLGGAKYSKSILKTFLQGEGAGVFSNTFGDALPFLKKLIKEKPSFIRVHLMWKDAHNFSKKDFPAIAKEAARLCPTVKANPQIKWYFSGACEHKLNASDALALAIKVRDQCGEAEYVNTPMHGGASLPGYINEYHGKNATPSGDRYAFSFDGDAAEDSNVEALKQRFQNAQYFMFWSPRYNGRWESNDPTPRPNRKGYADEKMIRSMQYLEGSKGLTFAPKDWIWKSHAENKGNGDMRAEKPVLISPLKAKKIELRRGGKVVAIMPYYGPFGSQSRYYAPKWGFELGIVDIFANGKKYGTVNSGFRDFDYR